MTNQKRGAAKLFYAAKKKWSDGPRDEPAAEKREKPRAGSHRAAEQSRRAQDAREREQQEPRGPKHRELRAPRIAEGAGEKRPRPLPGAQPLNQCAPAFVALRKKALAYPQTYEDHAQGQTLVKLKNKSVVVALGRENGGLFIACKLPRSGFSATSKFSFASPAGYGLGKQGWVQARFDAGDDVPLRMLLGWIEESYAAVAPPPRGETKAKAQRK